VVPRIHARGRRPGAGHIASHTFSRSPTPIVELGVHTNKCILGRSFSIKQMVRWGMLPVLIRDLADCRRNPARPPYVFSNVSDDEATRLVVGQNEKCWCPTIESGELLADL
jgi:hypothetical protein